MKIGFCGLGKLGLPVALAIESKGHQVKGYDINPAVKRYVSEHSIPFEEEGLQPLLNTTKLEVVDSVAEVVDWADIVFLPVQTPHDPLYEGVTRIPPQRADFDYSHLIEAIKSVVKAAEKPITLAVISTCLPNTFNEKIKPLIPENVHYVYTPQFIAMGTVLEDYLHPEFNLIGVDNEAAATLLEQFYATINDAPCVKTDITTAEGIKVFYNTYITQKIILANAHMQVSHKLGMNIDAINKAMSLGTRRIVGPRYMKSGGPDSGGCHPRDLIALSWLGDKIDLKPNWFEMMAQTRELQTEWSADLIEEEVKITGLPVYIMGKAFKPETNLTVGSGAILLANILSERGISITQYDPHIDEVAPDFKQGIYFIATEHEEFNGWNYPDNSIILDLWRSITPPANCLYIPIGNPNAVQDKRR